jgi:hypothetical protein
MNTDAPVTLDSHRGMTAQKETDIRRLAAEVQANEEDLQTRHADLEEQLLAVPASSWPEAVRKARYLLEILGASPAGLDPRRQKLIAAVLDDFERLSQNETTGPEPGRKHFLSLDDHTVAP